MNKRFLTASTVLAASLVLSACGGGDDPTIGSSGASAAPGAEASAGNGKGNDADVAFLVGMKPHHQQAVEMSEMVLAANPPADVAAIAQQIKTAQSPEIEQISTMLRELGQKVEDTPSGPGHGGGMAAGHGGMMSGAEMDALMKATGTEAARLYLEGMVRHHMGAIEASDVEIAGGKYGPAIELAKKIKAAQATEITTMQALLKSLK